MSTHSTNVSILRFPKDNQLDGDKNWRTYKHECVLVLKVRSLLPYVKGKIAEPSPNANILVGQTQMLIWSQTPLYEEWVTRDVTAASILVTNIRDPVSIGIEEEKSSVEIWKLLMEKFEKRVKQQIHLADTSLHTHI